MDTKKHWAIVFALLFIAMPAVVQAQQFTASEDNSAYQAERNVIKSALETVVSVIQEVTLQHESTGLTDRIRQTTAQLTLAARLASPTAPDQETVSKEDLEDLRRLLLDVVQQLNEIREALEAAENYELVDRLERAQDNLGEAVQEVERLSDRDADDDDDNRVAQVEQGDGWLRPGRYGSRVARDRDTDRARGNNAYNEDDDDTDDYYANEDEEDNDDRWTFRRHNDRWPHPWEWNSGAFVGDYSYRWPYRSETSLYRAIPSIRYNRVEGFVLGIGRQPLEWDSYRRSQIYGQIGYAFALHEWRYQIGVESRIDLGRRDDFALKIGGAYQRNTDTNDRWKTSWLENSLAAFFFENDFFDYHEVEGWTVYAAQRLSSFFQLSVGYRAETYRSLTNNTSWSLFDGDGFLLNSAISDGDMQSVVLAFEGGRVDDLHRLPRGAAFRMEAELGESFGGDFSFNRYIADGRVYLRTSRETSLGLRLRGGVSDGDLVPYQRTFTLGGIGSMRGYPQNVFQGDRMLLANAEYIVYDLSIFDDIVSDFQFLTFVDAGWVNTVETNTFSMDDVWSSAGIGFGFDDRAFRLELAWPLRDLGNGRNPSLWLRITPSF